MSYGYDDVGGLLKKSDYSQNAANAYSYLPGTHKVQSVALKLGGTASYGFDANGNVTQRTESGTLTTLHYDIGNLPMRMQRGFNTSDFYEGPGGRYLQRLVSNGTQRDTYTLDKSYEREMVGGAITLERYYLSSGALMTVAPGSRKLNYLHNDRLGSTVSISEKPMPDGQRLGSSVAVLVEHKGFDAFGKALDGTWGTSNFGMLNLTTGQNFNQGKRTQRGFTGHEHLDEFALIHMNGRVYDYNLWRFYGVDPFIQFPNNSQSLNPYGYLMNNPLSGVDPTGYMGCAASRIESACDNTAVEWGGRDTGNSGNKAVTFDVNATTNNGSEKSAQTVTVVFKPEQIKSIHDRRVTSFNVNTDEKGKITGANWTLGPFSEEIRDVSMFNPQVAAGMSAIRDAAARFVVGSYISDDSRGTYVALMEPGEWRMPGDDGIERVAPEMYLIGMGRPAMALAEGVVAGISMRGVIVSQVSESAWLKAVNPASNSLMRAWGRLTIKAQEEALVTLRAAGSPAANSVVLDRSTLFIENVGPALGRNQFSASYFSAWMRDSRALGTPLNDLRPGNYGQGFRAFDPAHDKATLIGGAIGGVTIGAAGACLAGAAPCK